MARATVVVDGGHAVSGHQSNRIEVVADFELEKMRISYLYIAWYLLIANIPITDYQK